MKNIFLIGIFLFISSIFIWDALTRVEYYVHDLKMKNDGYIFRSRVDDFPTKSNDSSEKIAEDFYAYVDKMVRDGINIKEIPISDLNVSKLIEGKYRRITYIDNNRIERKVIFDNSWIDYLNFSPSKEKLGFHYEHQDVPMVGGDVSVVIMDIANGDLREVYEGGFKTSYWEWLDENEIAVYYGCGTECMSVYIIDATTGKEKALLVYGVGHEWSPNKQLVLAYNYTVQYGIVVGDRYNNKLFTLHRDRDYNYNDMVTYGTQAEWSPDGSKIALFIKKDKKEEMELLVFDVDNDFQQIFQHSPVDFKKDAELSWINNGQSLSLGDLEINLSNM